MEICFHGKTILVTGGGRGIGKTIAMTFAQNGADILIGDVLDKEAEQTCAEIRSLGRKANYRHTDIAKYEEVEMLVNSVERIDFVAHAAGILLETPFLECTQNEIQRSFDINILGSNNIVQTALKKMIPQKSGSIVMIASVAGKMAAASMPHYRMSKAAVISLTMAAAHIAAPHNITVNAVCPGIVRTAMWDKRLNEQSAASNKSYDEVWDDITKSKIPLGRPQTPEDIANAITFLCSDLAKNITGQAINVCGGMCMGM